VHIGIFGIEAVTTCCKWYAFAYVVQMSASLLMLLRVCNTEAKSKTENF